MKHRVQMKRRFTDN